VLVARFDVMRILLLAGILVVGTNLLFVWLATVGPELSALIAVISADNLSGGLAGSAFIAYLSGLTNRAYTATQYALFSSLMLLPAKFLGGFSGDVVDAAGYVYFFSYAAILGLPAIVLVVYLMRRNVKPA
ncbi:MAG: AmpG family muropeptide MFS transporter, partial [Gammaproteobacteria bacterium]|nr:AmpG family muropeptide MFS transporter [Gammaproteobacteria bacterium]